MSPEEQTQGAAHQQVLLPLSHLAGSLLSLSPHTSSTTHYKVYVLKVLSKKLQEFGKLRQETLTLSQLKG